MHYEIHSGHRTAATPHVKAFIQPRAKQTTLVWGQYQSIAIEILVRSRTSHSHPLAVLLWAQTTHCRLLLEWSGGSLESPPSVPLTAAVFETRRRPSLMGGSVSNWQKADVAQTCRVHGRNVRYTVRLTRSGSISSGAVRHQMRYPRPIESSQYAVINTTSSTLLATIAVGDIGDLPAVAVLSGPSTAM